MTLPSANTLAPRSAPAIHVDALRKTFNVPVREAGLRAAIKSLVKREHREVRAVDDIGFEIGAGEIVGFLGPNGAGKTTTLKMLAGLLYPTSGEALVLGHVPSKREPAFLRQMTMVMGNRNQLQWDLPALDSFDLIRAIYRLDPVDFRRTRDEFIELLELGDLVNKPVRNLSLGERMKVETVGALLHRPQVLFLDEPTIGLDVTMQKRIRAFVADYNKRFGATVLLTSHYMADVQALCKRVVVIHHGRILFDGALAELAARFNATKTIGVVLKDGNVDLSPYGEVMSIDDDRVMLRVARADAPEVTTRLLRDLPVADLTIEDPPIEDVIEHVFAGAAADLKAETDAAAEAVGSSARP
jgi:ABC-2 type transport system ATP-binding protein